MLVTERRIGVALSTAGLLFIAAMTLVPLPDEAASVVATPLWCLICGDVGATDAVVNVLLFVPFGAGLGFGGLAWRLAILIVGTTTLAIEGVQMSLLIGRDASLGDLVNNTLGAGLGFASAHSWRAWLRPPPRVSRRLGLAGAILWLGLLGATAWALAPALSLQPYWALWAPDLHEFERFRGSVIAASVNGEALPPGRSPDSERLRERLLSNPTVLEVSVTAGGATNRLAPIVAVFDELRREMVLLGQERRDLVFRARTRAVALRFRTIAIRLPNAFAARPGDSVHVTGGFADRRYHISTWSANHSRTRNLSLSPSWGWALLLPFDYAFGSEVRWLSFLWVAGLLLPLGYWAGRGSLGPGGLPAAAVLGGAVILGLGGIPFIFELPAVHWSELAAAVLGATLGWRLGRLAVRLEHHGRS